MVCEGCFKVRWGFEEEGRAGTSMFSLDCEKMCFE